VLVIATLRAISSPAVGATSPFCENGLGVVDCGTERCAMGIATRCGAQTDPLPYFDVGRGSLERGAWSWAMVGLAAPALPSGCLVAQPSEIPDVRHAPTILPDESPPVDAPLLNWPTEGFSASVQADPGAVFSWAVFYDYDPGVCASTTCAPLQENRVTAPANGSLVKVSFMLLPSMMPVDGLCHRVDLVVADQSGSTVPPFYTPLPDGLGGDVVTWWYAGGLGLPDCTPYAGPLPDGGYSIPEAASDSPPPVPE
jgi:hypothetical protein